MAAGLFLSFVISSAAAYSAPAVARGAVAQPRRAPPPLAQAGLAFAPPIEGPSLREQLEFGGGGGGGNGGSFGGGGGGGGGGDSDDESSEFLRLLNSAEQMSVVDDWAARSRIYKMTDDAEIKAMHTAHLAEMEALREFDVDETGPKGRRMVLGLFRDDEIRAVSAAEVSHASGLCVGSLLVYPAELNDEDSTTTLRMMHALHLLADAIETPLDLSALEDQRAGDSLLESLVSELDEEL